MKDKEEEGPDGRDKEDDGGNTKCEGLVGGGEKDHEWLWMKCVL